VKALVEQELPHVEAADGVVAEPLVMAIHPRHIPVDDDGAHTPELQVSTTPALMSQPRPLPPPYPTLLDSGALPSAECTRQRLLCTQQSLCRVQHSAKILRQKIRRQRFLCRVLFIGHPAKTLPSANPAPGKEKWSLPPSSLALPGAMSEAPGKDFFNFFFKFSLLGAMPGRHPAKIFLFYFYNFFAGCLTEGAPGKEFFYFFS